MPHRAILSALCFRTHPSPLVGNVASNIIAGGIAEAGAQQAGDMMQDLKTGYLHQTSPRAQFFVQMLGATFSIFSTIAAWKLYNYAYKIPSSEFPAPSATLSVSSHSTSDWKVTSVRLTFACRYSCSWLDMALILNGESDSLPRHLTGFCVVAALIAGALPIVEKFKHSWKPWLPSPVAFGIGMYLVPYWTIPRFLGSLFQFVFLHARGFIVDLIPSSFLTQPHWVSTGCSG
eukprot:m.683643 g.683643  ORF g.683643 m.683643 type:complete len:232 (+) comp58605_c0_seq20:1763-2458(+)